MLFWRAEGMMIWRKEYCECLFQSTLLRNHYSERKPKNDAMLSLWLKTQGIDSFIRLD